MFSNSLKYSLKALTYLTMHSNKERKYGIKELAEKTEVPSPYLGKLLQKLVKQEILSSLKGPTGGFYLTDENRLKTVGDVVFLIDGSGKFLDCILEFKECNSENPCALHHAYAQVKGGFLNELASIPLSDLAKPPVVLKKLMNPDKN